MGLYATGLLRRLSFSGARNIFKRVYRGLGFVLGLGLRVPLTLENKPQNINKYPMEASLEDVVFGGVRGCQGAYPSPRPEIPDISEPLAVRPSTQPKQDCPLTPKPSTEVPKPEP